MAAIGIGIIAALSESIRIEGRFGRRGRLGINFLSSIFRSPFLAS